MKFEKEHHSALSEFLIERALCNPMQIGHYLFWHLKAEMHNMDICERYGLILEEYVLHCGAYGKELLYQQKLLDALLEVWYSLSLSLLSLFIYIYL